MTCAVVVEGPEVHHCNPGWEYRWHESDPDEYPPLPSGWYAHQLDVRPGTVVLCECGQLWVAEAFLPGEMPGQLLNRIHWRKPTWRQRRKLRADQTPRAMDNEEHVPAYNPDPALIDYYEKGTSTVKANEAEQDKQYDHLTFAEVTAANLARCRARYPGFPKDQVWTGADWSNAVCGEAGEMANVVKKMRRVETGTAPGPDDPPYDELRRMLADELADVFTYLDLLATFYGVDLPAAVVNKFNRVSERHGFPDRLPESEVTDA